MGMKGISRIDSRSTHGWFVRSYREGKAIGKFFSDGVHGGKQAALRVAKGYRDTYEKENPPNPLRKRLRTKIQRNNKTGVTGVSETYGRAMGGRGAKMPCFNVSWNPEPGVARSKKFFFSKYSSREAALEAAIEFRKEREAEIIQSVLGKSSKGKKRVRKSSPKTSKSRK